MTGAVDFSTEVTETPSSAQPFNSLQGEPKKRVISVVFSIIILYLYKSQFWYIRHHLKILGGFWKKEGMTIKRWFFACEFKIMYCNCKIQFYENPLKMRARAFWRNMLHEMNLNLLQDAFKFPWKVLRNPQIKTTIKLGRGINSVVKTDIGAFWSAR